MCLEKEQSIYREIEIKKHNMWGYRIRKVPYVILAVGKELWYIWGVRGGETTCNRVMKWVPGGVICTGKLASKGVRVI